MIKIHKYIIEIKLLSHLKYINNKLSFAEYELWSHGVLKFMRRQHIQVLCAAYAARISRYFVADHQETALILVRVCEQLFTPDTTGRMYLEIKASLKDHFHQTGSELHL